MRRLQIYIDEAMDEALTGEAGRQGTSKAALIRRFVAAALGTEGNAGGDPLTALIGRYEGEAGDIDETVYGRQPSR